MVPMKYCTKCGNTGIDIDGNPCDCRVNSSSFYETVSCLEIPEQYRGISFNESLVPKDLPEGYTYFLKSIHDDMLAGRLLKRNILICSPINHSKSILAYSCIEIMFRNGIPIVPLFDVLEVKRILLDFDLGKKQTYEVKEPADIVTVPLMFVKIPRITSWEVFDAIAVLLDRRVRRNNATVFIYDGSWNQLIYNDKQNLLTGLMGDGYYNTLEVKSWFVENNYNQKLPEIKLQDNIG